jgi:hypothetical protein
VAFLSSLPRLCDGFFPLLAFYLQKGRALSNFYNVIGSERLHSAIGCLTPNEVFAGKTGEDIQCRQGLPSLLAGSPDLTQNHLISFAKMIHFLELGNPSVHGETNLLSSCRRR